jgi:hypothetical protein
MELWKGDYRVWLLPDLKEPVRWYEKMGNIRFPVLGIPAERLDRLDIYHIGVNGHVWGPASQAKFPNGVVDGLLDKWLDLYNLDGGISYYHAPDTVTLTVPEVHEEGVSLRDAEFQLTPGPTLPIVGFDENSHLVKMKWPPDDRSVAPISLEAESADYYGPLKLINEGGLPIAISRDDPRFRSLHIVCLLPEPFEDLCPYGAGLDTLFGQARMRQIAETTTCVSTGILQAAKDAAGVYVREGQTTHELAWFYPTVQKDGVEQAVRAAWFRFDLKEPGTPEEAVGSSAWREKMMKSVPVRRAWGVLGLFWSLLLDRLADGEKFRFCERCKRTISGKQGKRFCGLDENRSCYRERRTADKRRERTYRRSRDLGVKL